MNDSNPCIATVDENGISYSERLKRLRIKSGKSVDELCDLLAETFINYEEWENHPGELTRVLSLGEISKLASALGVNTRLLFSDTVGGGESISFDQLCLRIKSYLTAIGISMEDFENRVGFGIGPSIENSSNILDWNLDCLRFVCAEISVNWLQALP